MSGGSEAATVATDVLVIGKRGRRDAHTVLAAGGMNAALATVDPEDSWQQHFADTLREGYLLGHPRVAEIMAREAPAAVRELQAWGCPFARTPSGEIDQRYFGAHTYRRTCYVGDETGKAIVHTLADRIEALGIPIVERVYVSRLLLDGERCVGAFGFDLHSGERTAFTAGSVVLATGGHTSLWHPNTSRVGENHGEGMAVALEAGCRLMDMELVQFHPTGLVAPPEMAGTLVTEAVRGEGGRLFNAQGERFMGRYDPERMELSTRDRVTLANYTEIVQGRGGPNGGVFLDVSHRGRDYIMEKLPKMYRQLLSFQGVDISKDPMEVAPTAHYSMGGVAVEPETHATDVPGLFAVGECATGLHGANRLGGNSLTDIMVFGRRAGEAAANRAGGGASVPRDSIAQAGAELDALARPGDVSSEALGDELRTLMWTHAGVVRDEGRLDEGLALLDELRAQVTRVDADGAGDLARALDLRAAVVTAEVTLRCARERRETRGCHNRTDFPATDPSFAVNFYARRGEDGGLAVRSEPVPPIPDDLCPLVDECVAAGEPEQAGRLLE
jgi:succinate dehydrogenase / fumarate reductase flavoprotein subunit